VLVLPERNLGFLYCLVIALWENQTPAGQNCQNFPVLIAAEGWTLGSAGLVEYVFASRSAVDRLQETTCGPLPRARKHVSHFARGASAGRIARWLLTCGTLGAGRTALACRNSTTLIVSRNLDPKGLPIGVRVRITTPCRIRGCLGRIRSRRHLFDRTTSNLRERCEWIADAAGSWRKVPTPK